MINFGRQLSRLTRTVLSPNKLSPLTQKLNYPFAGTPLSTQKKSSPSPKSQIPSPKAPSPSSPRKKANGSNWIKPSPMFRPIKLQFRSRVLHQAYSPSFMPTPEIPSQSENLCLESTSTPPNLREPANPQKKKKSRNLHRPLNLHKPNQLPNSKLPRSKPPKPTNPNQQPPLLPLLLPQSSPVRENKPENPCPDSDKESPKDSKNPKTPTLCSPPSRKSTCKKPPTCEK